jgi:hypothetical protein
MLRNLYLSLFFINPSTNFFSSFIKPNSNSNTYYKKQQNTFPILNENLSNYIKNCINRSMSQKIEREKKNKLYNKVIKCIDNEEFTFPYTPKPLFIIFSLIGLSFLGNNVYKMVKIKNS